MHSVLFCDFVCLTAHSLVAHVDVAVEQYLVQVDRSPWSIDHNRLVIASRFDRSDGTFLDKIYIVTVSIRRLDQLIVLVEVVPE